MEYLDNEACYFRDLEVATKSRQVATKSRHQNFGNLDLGDLHTFYAHHNIKLKYETDSEGFLVLDGEPGVLGGQFQPQRSSRSPDIFRGLGNEPKETPDGR